MNENIFTGKADVYAKHRPTYPQALVDYLYNEIGFGDKSVVADIGSGTGILTELLLLRNSKVFAVEPNEDMRKTAENKLGHFANFISVNGSAENTGLVDASCDFITIAQAFHWLDRLRFKNECKRILKTSGKIAIVYNSRDNSSAFISENEKINRQFCPNFKGFSGGLAIASPEEFRDFFKNGICDFKVFENDTVYDEQGFIGRSLSASYALRPHESKYALYIAALKTLFEKYNTGGTLRLPTIATSFIGEVC